ncbi:MAG: hypothetical protein AAB675_00500 [Patescibacteria group bacterium]
MIDKEPGLKKSQNPLKRLVKAGIPVIAGGLALSGQGSGQVSEISPTLPFDTPIPAVDIAPSFQDTGNQVIPVETPEVTALRSSVADKFGIEIQTFDEISKAPDAKYLYGLFDNVLYPVHDWNKENLDLLDRVLSYLPKSLYEPREDGEKVHIILGPASICGWDVKTFTPDYPREVMASYSYFRAENPLSAAWVMAHEFAHLQTMDSCTTGDKSHLTETSPYFKKIDEILEGEFVDVKKGLSGKLGEQESQFEEEIEDGGRILPVDYIKTPEEEQKVRLTRFKYGISKDMPSEFIAVIAESYFLGRDYFQRMYGPFFPQDVVDSLYEFARDDIFDGTEYTDYHKTAFELGNLTNTP